ncbi:hypothetical protein [Arthrobacter sp. H35-D1]|uniref:Y-family DNA polymerase n=1 Tax=Arthrobacter sp. H35-D1 TaxID=3046202 RepID=UPI0032D58BD7
MARSSNYELYGDMSARVMEVVGRFGRWQEVYSIDESFVGLLGNDEQVQAAGSRIRAAVMQHVGVPVCVGVAGTTGTGEYSRVAYSARFIRIPPWDKKRWAAAAV